MVRTNSFSRDGFITKGELKLANKNSSMKEITQVTKHLRPGVTPCRKVEEPVLVIKMALNLKTVALYCQWGIWSFCFRKLTTTILISTNGSTWTNSRKVASRPKSTRQFLFTTIANKYQQENVAFFDAAFNFQTPINPMPYHPIQYCKCFDVLPKNDFEQLYVHEKDFWIFCRDEIPCVLPPESCYTVKFCWTTSM